MDPHLTVVRDWDKDYIPSEKEAYYEARINRYIFLDDIGSLTQNELERIASHPPSIDHKRYKYYRNMNTNELKREFPALVDIIGEKITYEDLFYYATRGWIPEYDTINYKIDRWNKYNDMSNVGKSLMNILYGDKYGYINSDEIHYLEQIILDYDANMDDENVLRSIADRFGVTLPYDEYSQDSFYDILIDIINNNN